MDDNYKFTHISYLYILVYILSFIAIFMESTQVNGIPMYLSDPTYSTFWGDISKIVVALAIIINILLFIINKLFSNNNKHNGAIFLFIILCVFKIINNFIYSPIISNDCFLFYLLILNADLVNSYSFIKIDAKLKVSMVTLVVFAYFLHLFPANNDAIIMRDNVIRYSWGFIYSNVLASAVLGAIFSIIIAYGKKFNRIFLLIITGIIGLIFFYATDSRSMGIIIIFLIISFILIKSKSFVAFIEKYTPYIVIFSLILSIIIVITFKSSSPVSLYFNKLMSGRLKEISHAVSLYPIKFVGHVFPEQTNMYDSVKSILVDNGFFGFLITFGILGTIFYEYFFIKSGIIAYKFRNIFLCLILISMSIQFIFEADYDKCWMISPLIYAFSLYYNKLYRLND